MRDFFSATTGIPFEAFGVYHLIVLAIVAVSILGLYLARERLRRSPRERIFRIVLGCVGIASEVSLHLWQIMNGIWTFADSAPIAICFFSLALGVFVMFTKSRRVFEIAYFWAIGGVASILFPDIPYGPDRVRFYEYLIGHLSFFLMFMYTLFVHGYRPTLRSFAKSALILLGITLFVVYPIDLLTGANFLFLLDPAGTPFELLLPLTGEGFYVPGVILTAAIVMGLWGCRRSSAGNAAEKIAFPLDGIGRSYYNARNITSTSKKSTRFRHGEESRGRWDPDAWKATNGLARWAATCSRSRELPLQGMAFMRRREGRLLLAFEFGWHHESSSQNDGSFFIFRKRGGRHASDVKGSGIDRLRESNRPQSKKEKKKRA